MSQNITQTGGLLYATSRLQRFDDFDRKNKLYNGTLFAIGLYQPLFRFNPLKWDKKIEPLKYNESQQEYLESLENIALQANQYFFDLLLAQVNLQIADTNLSNTENILRYFKKFTDFETPTYTIIEPYKGAKTSFIARTTPSVSADFEARFAKSLRQLGKNWNIEILHMDDMKADKNSMVIIPFIISFIVCGFLIINVAFGLFGVLFQNINRRRGEIGIRRAMGATEGDIMRQFVGEMGVLATFAIVLGIFFAVQFPILKVFDVATSVYMWGIVIAMAAVYTLVLLCSWFPSRQAAAIYPAMALHEE